MPSPRRSPSSTRAATRSTEYVLAVAVATYADAIGVPLVASKNGAYSSARVGAAYKRMGVRAGFPDLNIPKVGGRDEPGLSVYVVCTYVSGAQSRRLVHVAVRTNKTATAP